MSPHRTARVVATHVWPSGADVPVPADPLELDWGGPVGDRHHGLTMRSDSRQREHYERGTEIRNHRQVSLVDAAEMERVAAALGIPRMDPGLIADNVYTEGIPDLTGLPPLTRLVFASGAVLLLWGENTPCTIAGAMVSERYGTRPEAFPKAAMGLRGVTGWVEHPGPVRPGDGIEVRLPHA
ncbi:MAG: hypothetical protein R2737_04230 [Candidatus Nanopelagicales bacterium]